MFYKLFKWFFHLLLWKEKYIWKVFCIFCTFILFLQLFADYFIVKPTVSSVAEISLEQVYFPDVFVCLENGFDKKRLNLHGYDSSGNFYFGINQAQDFIGWSGFDTLDPFRKDSNTVFKFQ